MKGYDWIGLLMVIGAFAFFRYIYRHNNWGFWKHYKYDIPKDEEEDDERYY